MASGKQLSKVDVAEIFKRTEQLYPNLLINQSTGEKYTVNHPAAEGLATIFKIKLDEFDRTNQMIEEGKRKCLAAAGCKSVEDLLKRRPRTYDNDVESRRPPAPTLGDFMKISEKPQRRNRKHK
jgi:hypothetical protein